MSASSSAEAVVQSSMEPFLAADVGGTHVRLGLVRIGNDAKRPVLVQDYRKYRCADYDGLASIIAAFMQDSGIGKLRRGVVASAGYALEDGSVITANLPWRLAPAEIRDALGMDALHLVNDFEAVAYAANYMVANEVLHLSGPQEPAQGPVLVLGPGTGLGAALWIPVDGRAVVLPTEAGHAGIAAGNALELELLQVMLRDRSHVPTEHFLSGPGLLNIYRALCVLRQAEPVHGAPAEVTGAAVAGSDPIAVQALSVFCEVLGSVSGDLALLYGVRGGIYLAGGFLPQIGDFLARSGFVERFLNKGSMRPALEHVPVKVVEHGQLGVIGAANWFLQHDH